MDFKYIASSKYFIYLIAALVYLIVSLLLFYPVIGNPATTVLGSPTGDIYQFLFYIWWSKYALLTAHTNPYTITSLLFWPVGTNTAFSTLSPVASIISIPLQYISLQFAYNFIFFLGFVLAGIGAFLLAEYVVKDRYAAFLCGLFFAFSSWHILVSASEFDLFSIGLIPFFLYFFMRSIRENKLKLIVVTGVLLMLIAFMDTIEEFLLSLIVAFLIILYITLFESLKKTNKQVLNDLLQHSTIIVIVVAVALILGVWGFWPLFQTFLTNYNVVQESNSFLYGVPFSPNILSFFLPNYVFAGRSFESVGSTHLNILYSHTFSQASYIGYSLLFLCIYAIIKSRKDEKGYKVWLFLAIITFLLSLGPVIYLGSTPLFYGPYALFHYIPLFNVIREPDRFETLTSLFLAIIGAIGFSKLSQTYGKNKQTKLLLVSAISIIFLFENFGIPYYAQSSSITTSPSVPPIFKQISNAPQNFSFLVLPTSTVPDFIYSGISDYYVTQLDRPSVTGYVSRSTQLEQYALSAMPLISQASYLALYNNVSYATQPFKSPVMENYTLQSIKMLEDYDVGLIIIENKAYEPQNLNALLYSMADVFGKPLYEDGNVTLFTTAPAEGLLNNSIVEVPNPFSWSYANITPNGQNMHGWTPTNHSGVIVAYSFYPNTSSQFTNVTMHFFAISPYTTQHMSVVEYPISGPKTGVHATVSVDQQGGEYSVNMQFANGQQGNIVIFEDGYANSNAPIILINDISFTKG